MRRERSGVPGFARQVLLFGPPALLAIVNLRHPVLRTPIYRAVSSYLPWWSTLHFINLGLFALLGLAVYLLLSGVDNAAASVSRVAVAVFVPLYAAFDALAGIGTGLLARLSSELPVDQTAVAESIIDRYWSSGTIAGLAVAGSVAWVIAALAAAVAITAPERRKMAGIVAVIVFLAGGWARDHLFTGPGGMTATPAWWLVTLASGVVMLVVCRPGIAAGLLTLAALCFGAAHVPPTGPLGAACFLVAALVLEFKPPGRLGTQSAEQPAPRMEASP
jgi:hypothetical protein